MFAKTLQKQPEKHVPQWLKYLVKYFTIFAAILTGVMLLLPWVLRSWVTSIARDSIYTNQTAPENSVALVLGAGLWRDGSQMHLLW